MFFNEFKNSNTLVSHLQQIGKAISIDNAVPMNNMFFTSTPIYDNNIMAPNNMTSGLNITTSTLPRMNSSVASSSFNSTTSSSSLLSNESACCSSSSSSSSSRSSCSIKTNNGAPPLHKKSKKILPMRSTAIDMTNIIQNSKYQNNKNQFCSFCKSNGESEDVYSSHLLKDPFGKVACPILRVHVCPICGEHGDNAHTISYCKQFIKTKRIQMLQDALRNISN